MPLKIDIQQSIPLWIIDIASHLQKHSFTTYLVGGAIRNVALGKPVEDYDLATDATPPDVLRIFKRTIPTGIKFGTVTVLWKSNKAEITTLRNESSYLDSRHPETIQFDHDIVGDLSRRDFTINAMAYDILARRFYDPFNGLQDAQKGVIRTVGKARMRMKEDALRMLRSVRLASQYNLSIAHSIINTCRLLHRNLSCISRERVGVELHKIVMSDFPSIGIHYLCNSYLLYIVNVDVALLRNINKNATPHTITPHLFDSCYRWWPTEPVERYALFIVTLVRYVAQDSNSDLIKTTDAICSSLINCGIKKGLMYDVNAIVRGWLNLSHEKNKNIGSYSTFIRAIGKRNISSLYNVISALPINWVTSIDLEVFTWCCNNIIIYSVKDLRITGNDLIQLGITRGVLIGKTLNSLLHIAINNPTINTRYDLLALAQHMHGM